MGEAARVTDDLYTAVTNANISLTDLAQSISYAGADMATAGVDQMCIRDRFINNEPQDEYRAVDWKLESSSDWLEAKSC